MEMPRLGTHKPAVLVAALLLCAACGDNESRSESKESSSTFKSVDEVMSSPEQWVGKTIRVRGNVAPGTIMKAIRGTQTSTRFDLELNGKRLIIQFKGPTPDTFRDNAEVVVTGTLEERRGEYQLQGTEMLAKCPDDYKPPSP